MCQWRYNNYSMTIWWFFSHCISWGGGGVAIELPLLIHLLLFRHSFGITFRWPFEPVRVKLCFLRGPLRILTAAKNANGSVGFERQNSCVFEKRSNLEVYSSVNNSDLQKKPINIPNYTRRSYIVDSIAKRVYQQEWSLFSRDFSFPRIACLLGTLHVKMLFFGPFTICT